MDIISHTLTGIAVGTVLATISKNSGKRKGLIILTGGIGGAIPDFDAISLWSKFDLTIGTFLGLNHSGKEIYFGKFWYSHHAALHSLIAPVVLILTILIVNLILNRKVVSGLNIFKSIKVNKLLILAFFFGFVFHLLEDMPTPSSVWGGVNLFFPSSIYIGGYGNIWWWNNYDLVLIISSVIALNLLVNILPNRFLKFKRWFCISVFFLGLGLFIFQTKTRPVDFSYIDHTTKYYEFEAQSKSIQKSILGDKLFQIMSKIDNRIPFNF